MIKGVKIICIYNPRISVMSRTSCWFVPRLGARLGQRLGIGLALGLKLSLVYDWGKGWKYD